VIGFLVSIIGVFWRWGPWKRPVGLTFLAASYGLAGLIAVFIGGWLFTGLFLLGIIFFAIAWAIIRGKSLARMAVYLITCLGLLMSLIGITNADLIYIPGVLQSVYIFWYLNRPQVAEYFNLTAIWEMDTSRRTLVFLFVVPCILIPYLSNLYINPPTYTVFSDKLQGWGTGPGGGSGWYFAAKHHDLLAYSFAVDVDSSPIRFSIESTQHPPVALVSSEGRSDSGIVEIPFTSEWEMWAIISEGTYMSVEVEMSITEFSLRVPVTQWLFLVSYVTALLLLWIIASEHAVLRVYV